MGAWWGLLHSHGRGNLLRIKFIYSVQKQCETDLINSTPMKHFCHEEWKVTVTFFYFHHFGMKFLTLPGIFSFPAFVNFDFLNKCILWSVEANVTLMMK